VFRLDRSSSRESPCFFVFGFFFFFFSILDDEDLFFPLQIRETALFTGGRINVPLFLPGILSFRNRPPYGGPSYFSFSPPPYRRSAFPLRSREMARFPSSRLVPKLSLSFSHPALFSRPHSWPDGDTLPIRDAGTPPFLVRPPPPPKTVSASLPESR